MISRLVTALLIASSVAAATGTVRVDGILGDVAFPPPGPYRFEVLETGDTLSIIPDQPFSLRLPARDSWTLCARGRDGEGCFRIARPGTDTLFTVLLEGGALTPDQVLLVDPDPHRWDADTLAEVASEDVTPVVIQPPDDASEILDLGDAVARGRRASAPGGRETLDADRIRRLPGLAEADVIRAIQGLPGVVASSDFSTKIYVRGGASDQNLILFDNAVVYSPVHFFGLFSTFLVEGIDEVTFYKGGFPPEYGNRLSSVLDIQSRKGGNDTVDTWFRGSSVKISTIASQAHTEGRQGDFSWLFAGRTTYIRQLVDYLRDQGLTDLILDYYFYDLQGHFAYALGPDREIGLSVYQGRDRLKFDPFLIEWGNTVIPLNLRWRFSNDLATSTTLSYSLMSQSFGLEDLFEFYNNIVTWKLRHSVEYTGLDDHRLLFGGSLEHTSVVFRNTQDIAGVTFRDAPDFLLASAFAQDSWIPAGAREWELVSGARLNFLTGLNAFTAEPRFTVRRQLPANQSVEAHAGYYVQHVNSILFSDQENLNEFYYPATRGKYRSVPPSSSLLLALGYSRRDISGIFDFTLEGYYKALYDLVVSAPDAEVPDSIRNDPEAEFADFFRGAEGYSYGFEAELRKPGGVVSGGLSYAHGVAVIREETFEKAYFPSWHQPHSAKADLAVNWIGRDGIWPSRKQGRYFRSSTQAKYATGLPYTRVTGYQPSHLIDQNQGRPSGGPGPEFQGNIQTENGSYNMSFVPSYFRWDVKPVDWGREGRWNFSFTMLNITDHENVLLYSYDRSTNPPERLTIPQFPFFPFLLSYEFYF